MNDTVSYEVKPGREYKETSPDGSTYTRLDVWTVYRVNPAGLMATEIAKYADQKIADHVAYYLNHFRDHEFDWRYTPED